MTQFTIIGHVDRLRRPKAYETQVIYWNHTTS